MGDLRTNPYKIAQVFKLSSLLLSNPNLTDKDNVFDQATMMYLCRRQKWICPDDNDVFVQVVRKFKMVMENNSYFLHMGTKWVIAGQK